MRKIKLPKIKKDIGVFLSSEEAKIVKSKALKAGIGLTMAAIALAKPLAALAQHTNYFSGNPNDCGCGCHVSHASHASHGSHASHASHASHSSY